jgi:hypothetical protein
MKRSGFHCNTFTGNIADCNDDLDAMKSKLAKRVSRKRLHTSGCDSLALP